MKKIRLIVSGLVFAGVIISSGWENGLIGIRSLSMGAFAGLADDASAIFYNPAGIAFIKNRLVINAGETFVNPHHTWIDSSGQKRHSWFNTIQHEGFVTFRLGERGDGLLSYLKKLTIGFGVYTPYGGMGLDWKDVTKSGEPEYDLNALIGVTSIASVLAYPILNSLSLGIRWDYYLGSYRYLQDWGIAEIELSGNAKVSAIGLGALYKPFNFLSLGFEYRGPARLVNSGEMVQQIGFEENIFPAQGRMSLPYSFSTGIGFQRGNFKIGLDSRWTAWSSLDTLKVTVNDTIRDIDTTLIFVYNFHNTNQIRLGGEYLLPAGFSIRMGFSVDQQASPDSTLGETNIDVPRISFGGGVGYRREDWAINLVAIYSPGKEKVNRNQKFNFNVFSFGAGISYYLF